MGIGASAPVLPNQEKTVLQNPPIHWRTLYNTEELSCKKLLQWKNNIYYIFWVCVCSLGYPACKEHASYYTAIYVLSDYTLFSHIIS
jgi:hypothetical protein